MRVVWLPLNLALSVGLFAFSARTLAAPSGCSNAEAALAEANTDHIKTWNDLHASYMKFRGCDDGAIAEGYSDFVVRTLASGWDQVPTLNQLGTADPRFRAFVLRHIDATADFGDLAKAAENAEHRCPKGAGRLCSAVREAAQRALRNP